MLVWAPTGPPVASETLKVPSQIDLLSDLGSLMAKASEHVVMLVPQYDHAVGKNVSYTSIQHYRTTVLHTLSLRFYML